MKSTRQSPNLRSLTRCGVLAALYVVLTVVPPLNAISFGALQLRVAEALCVLPFFFPETAWGLVVGCLLANLFSPNILPADLLLGTFATALGAFGARAMAEFKTSAARWLSPLPNVLSNTLIVPAIIAVSTEGDAFWVTYVVSMPSIFIGEVAACFGVGALLILLLTRFSFRFNRQE